MSRHAIDLALDLARVPALVRTSGAPPIPADIVEIMRIAAAHPQACQDAESSTGEPATVLIEAARFYLQQVLFQPGADCYRILGIDPAASRTTARDHMRLLLQWLHPDRNGNWDAVYAERVLKAWHEVSSAGNASEQIAGIRAAAVGRGQRDGEFVSVRFPWIEYPKRSGFRGAPLRVFIVWMLPVGLLIVVLALWSSVY
jgi:hypothetical protein